MQFQLFDPNNPENRYWTVSTLTRHIKDWLESDTWLNDCNVSGEISNLSRPSSGHIYFTLKDAGAQLRCVMWRTQAARLRTALTEGQQVEVHGQITVYEQAGQYQLIADRITPTGEGRLYQEFVRLKARLEAEGWFDPARKRPLPELPAVIGLVTSPSGAAVQDMLQTIARRFPPARVVLAPAQVQGEAAPASILAALAALCKHDPLPDVIIIARGGGSMEDLWCFNDEQVVRAVAEAPIPVVSGVGHETDFTLVDFAADLRAPTPTAAAELVTPDQAELRAYHLGLAQRMNDTIQRHLCDMRRQVEADGLKLSRFAPLNAIQTGRLICDGHLRRMDTAVSHRLQMDRGRVLALNGRLAAVNPYAVLDRGYSIVHRQSDGTVVHSVHQVQQDDSIQVQTGDGSYLAVVK